MTTQNRQKSNAKKKKSPSLIIYIVIIVFILVLPDKRVVINMFFILKCITIIKYNTTFYDMFDQYDIYFIINQEDIICLVCILILVRS